MHAFPTTSLHTTNNQFSILTAQDSTNSNASAVCLRTSSPPPLSPISETSMHMAMDDRSKYISQRFYALLAAISQLGTNTPQSSTTQGTNTTPDSLKGNTDRGVSVKLEKTGTNDVQEALRHLQFKHTCIYKQQEQEQEQEEQKRANQTENQKQEQEEPKLYAYLGEGWIATTSELFTVPNDNGTFTQANYHKYYLDNPKYPLISHLHHPWQGISHPHCPPHPYPGTTPEKLHHGNIISSLLWKRTLLQGNHLHHLRPRG